MVVIMKHGFTPEQLDQAVQAMEAGGVRVMVSKGSETTILGAEGDAGGLNQETLAQLPGVERVMQVSEPYKKANRKYHPDDSVIDIGGVSIGGKKLAVIAGPCSVESEEQILEVAQSVRQSGAAALRGGAYKPRTSPYAFQGKGVESVLLLDEARKAAGLPIVSELMSADQLPLFEEAVDVIQIGARNMQNFDLLKKVGRTNKPILLKRGLSSTIEEWLMSAEYIMAGGNPNVILCERGIRTFETYTRNTLDLSAVLAVKRQSHPRGGGPVPRLRQSVDGGAHGHGGGGRRGGRPDHRGAQQPVPRPVRRGAVGDAGRVRRDDGQAAPPGRLRGPGAVTWGTGSPLSDWMGTPSPSASTGIGRRPIAICCWERSGPC